MLINGENRFSPFLPPNRWLRVSLLLLPVVSKALVTVCVECASRGKHDGGVEVGDDTADCVGRIDTRLGTT